MANQDLIVIPDNVPAHILNPEAAAKANEDALAGISMGFPPSIKSKLGKFRLVDGAGDETVMKAKDLVEGEYLTMVVLRARKPYEKIFYAAAYDPSQSEGKAPDCQSFDGEKPDSSVAEPQSKVCASCPQNAFGSGRNSNGEPTKGKACRDLKVLATFCKGGIYRFAINPGSLKNWGAYVSALSQRGISLGNVKTLVGFSDDDANIMTFQFGGFLDVDVIQKLSEKAQSTEVVKIIEPSTTPAPAPAPKAAPESEPAGEASTDDLGLDEEPEKKPKPKEKPKAAPKPKAEKKADPEPESEPEVAGPSDDELAAALDL